MKVVVARPRPDALLMIGPAPHGFSYPSGHTAFTCALVVAVLFALRDWRWRWVAAAAGAALVMAVAGSRMYLGVHYPSDVAAAVVLVVSTAAILVPVLTDLDRRGLSSGE